MNKINVSDYFKVGYIYYLWEGEEIVYVGQSTMLSYRIKQHLDSKVFDSFTFIRCPIEDMNILEGKDIIRLNPKYNRRIEEKNGYYSINSILTKAHKIKNLTDRNTMIGSRLLSKFLQGLNINNINLYQLHNVDYINIKDLKKSLDIAIGIMK